MDAINRDVELFLKDIQLTDKRNERVKELSGGMKRKLSVLLALIGGSKVRCKRKRKMNMFNFIFLKGICYDSFLFLLYDLQDIHLTCREDTKPNLCMRM